MIFSAMVENLKRQPWNVREQHDLLAVFFGIEKGYEA